MQELKARQNPTSPASSGTASSSTTGSKTPPPVPTAPKPARTTGPNTTVATTSAGKKTPPPVPTAPKPVRANSTLVSTAAAPAESDAVPTTEKEKSVAAGLQLQLKNKTVQKAGSISAGAGGIEINAAGGDVNLVGTNMATSGDANIAAAGDVNITATKNTESGFGLTVAGSMDKKSEAPTTPAPTGAVKKTPPPVPTAPKPARTTGSTGTTPAAGTSGTTPAPSTTGAKTPPPVPTAPKPVRTAGTTGTTPATSTANTKTPPPVPTAPKPARTTGSSSTTPASSAKTEKTQPSVSTVAKAIGTGVSIGTTGVKPPASTVWKGEAGTSATTTPDPDNTSSTFVGIGGGGSIQNQGATIKTGGAVNITSGGKTTLVNTDIKADAGENINAAGGVEKKIVSDINVLNADTNTGPAAVSEMVSKVPMSDNAPGGGATTPGVAPATAVAPQSSLKAAQGGVTSSPAGKKK